MKAYHLKQLYLNIFRGQSKNKAINSLKALTSIVEIRDVVDCVKGVYASISKDIEGVLYPQTLDELCKKPSIFFRPNSVVEEINWILSYMRGHWENITWFVEKKIQFENSFLLGKYEESLEWLNKSRVISEKVLPSDHPSLATIYNNIGLVYCIQRNYEQALKFWNIYDIIN